MATWMRLNKKGEISDDDFVVLVDTFCEGESVLKESALVHAGRQPRLENLLRSFFAGKRSVTTAVVKCWQERVGFHRRQWPIKENV